MHRIFTFGLHSEAQKYILEIVRNMFGPIYNSQLVQQLLFVAQESYVKREILFQEESPRRAYILFLQT